MCSYDLDDYYSDYRSECEDCSKEKERKEYAADFFMGVLEYLYNDEPLDKGEFENHLDELCSFFETSLPNKELQIDRKCSLPDSIRSKLKVLVA